MAPLLNEVERLRAMVPTEAIDAQRWATIRAAVLRLDAAARPGPAMGDDDIEQVVLRVLERAGRRAQKAPEPMGWTDGPDGQTLNIGVFRAEVRSSGWRLCIPTGGIHPLIADWGPETGPAGKAACEAAYRRACGLPAPVAPQVVRLHQAYEGTKVCLHCGEPQPWPEMDRCPRDSGIPAIPACAG
ncbi:MAG: hypothetical protein EBT79_15000 [Actinobacteria bacterium]|nr:hypothetical protein [Actinomycetota bacterium]